MSDFLNTIIENQYLEIEKLKAECERLTRQNKYWESREMDVASCCYHNEQEAKRFKKQNAKLTRQVEILKKALEFVSICGHDDECLFINSADESNPEFECECYCGQVREALMQCEGVE